MILSNFLFHYYLFLKFRVIRLQNGLTALLISDLGGAHYYDMSCKDYEEGSSPTKRIKRDVWKVNNTIQLALLVIFSVLFFT